MPQGGQSAAARNRAETLLRQHVARYRQRVSRRSAKVEPGGMMIEWPMDAEMIDDDL